MKKYTLKYHISIIKYNGCLFTLEIYMIFITVFLLGITIISVHVFDILFDYKLFKDRDKSFFSFFNPFTWVKVYRNWSKRCELKSLLHSILTWLENFSHPWNGEVEPEQNHTAVLRVKQNYMLHYQLKGYPDVHDWHLHHHRRHHHFIIILIRPNTLSHKMRH